MTLIATCARTMTHGEIAAVKDSWAVLEPERFAVGERFYLRLFKLDPSLRPLFRGDLSEQGRRLSVMLDIAVTGLDNLAVLGPILRALGERHAAYGVDAQHYGTVGAALLWAIGTGLGTAFSPEIESAWSSFYGLIAETMQDREPSA